MKFTQNSYMFDMILFELQDIAGKEHVSTRTSDKEVYSIDYFWISEMWHDRQAGRDIIRPMADFIVHPANAEEVSKVLKVANNYKIPVTTWGGGSGSQGGALPVFGGIILDTKRMDKIYKIDEKSMTVEVGTGIIHQTLEWELEQKGLSTMHDPASSRCATVGGFIAHRGTGVLSTKYGKIEDMIVNMEVVLPTGEIINTLPVPKTACGPDLNQIFIGSEGTLGVVTKVTLTIHRLPESRKFRAFIFKDLSTGLRVGQRLISENLQPSVIRLYSENETKEVIKKVLGIEKTGAYLVYGFDGKQEMVDLQMKYAKAIADEEEGEDLGTDLGAEWWKNRYKFFFPPYMFHLPQCFGTLDTVATFSNIENVYNAMKDVVETKYPMARFIGHFSHWFPWGAMLYARFIIETPPEDPHEALFLHNSIWNDALRAAMKAGGVLNEHHGIGLKLSRLTPELYGDAWKIVKKLKGALDPNSIMNPGKLGFGV
ncbi:MAG: alkylglycerone-phosphate synthase [Bacteroidetes bacterium GWF2_42_66]|nr:MAG: alkylglycerone-phosphate synthase [Bacteroidetes bacterium GWE2_42_39]OFY42506.1 MAG: alkylglycerone-phosphate synthase [Bacteroidetes bacterium GWF2_42_66]HAZ02798.1 FAD-binding oxidoreductase [Marinilabiliales bacterium]HBL74221.1 FAD-binding oxidoreductase [Prolixibacteraceae bacterium]HCU63990.1 FAD-binding oxidoreductase [Prolixibacteraceae bacterium]